MGRPSVDKMYTPQFQADVVAYFKTNKTSIQKTAVKFNIKWASVRSILLNHNVFLDDKKRYTVEQQLDIVNKYCSGYSTIRLQQEEKVDVNTIIKVLKKYHVIMRNPYPGKGNMWMDPDKKKNLIARMSGENNLNWKGGITAIKNKLRTTTKYFEWRMDVFHRDEFTCQICKIKNGMGKRIKFEAHHIVFLETLVESNNIKTLEEAMNCEAIWDLNNGQCLCKECHTELHLILKIL